MDQVPPNQMRGALPTFPQVWTSPLAFPATLTRPRYAALSTRTPHPSLYSDGSGDVSKCPFFGGPNGGGLGDANIVTGALFVAVVLVLRWALLRLFAAGPRGVLASLVLLLNRLPGAHAVVQR